jgi:hypothetical protein
MIVSARIPALDMRRMSFKSGTAKRVEDCGDCGRVCAAAVEAVKAQRTSTRIAEKAATLFMFISTPPETYRISTP